MPALLSPFADPTVFRPSARGPRRRPGALLALLPLLAGLGCLTSAGVGPNADAPLELAERVDLERFMGRWYVIESMPTGAEEGAHDAVETYALLPDGRIDIDFRFRAGGFDGPVESIPQVGWVVDERTNAEWRVRPIWPLALAYLILEVGPDYGYAVIGHPSKRYVWIMSRTPSLDGATRAGIRGRLAAAGYDVDRIRTVPQRPLGRRD